MLRFTKERRKLGLSQKRLANFFGSTQPVISHIETGRLKPYESWRERLERVFGMPMEALFEEVKSDD